MAKDETVWNPGWDAFHANPTAEPREPEVVLEPLFWGLFSLGGFLTAFLLPVTIFLLSFAVPLGFWPADRLAYDAFHASFQSLLVRAFYFVLIVGALFHGAHRFKFMLLEAGLHKHDGALAFVLYGLAILGSLGALYLVLKGWLL